ncbi:MAG: hypothetical protein JJT88_13425 [Gammaproteobacteria bacterium]|nr:hypothetical protein [Gammaproteobacteria bacterium]
MTSDRIGVLALTIAMTVNVAWADEEAVRDDFTRTAIPENVEARFICYQAGSEILSIDRVATFLPAKVQGVMSFSLNDRRERTHLVYLDAGTTCRLEVSAPRN